jgi:hypothetical protein
VARWATALFIDPGARVLRPVYHFKIGCGSGEHITTHESLTVHRVLWGHVTTAHRSEHAEGAVADGSFQHAARAAENDRPAKIMDRRIGFLSRSCCVAPVFSGGVQVRMAPSRRQWMHGPYPGAYAALPIRTATNRCR